MFPNTAYILNFNCLHLTVKVTFAIYLEESNGKIYVLYGNTDTTLKLLKFNMTMPLPLNKLYASCSFLLFKLDYISAQLQK